MGQEKGENSVMSYLNSITLVGFVGSDPDQRQAKRKRFEVHRALGRYTALVEKRWRRMELESRVASDGSYMELDFDSSEEFRGVAGAMMFVRLRFHLCHLPGSFSEAFSAR